MYVRAILRREKPDEKPDTQVRDWSVAKAIEHILYMIGSWQGEITVLNTERVEVTTPIPLDNGRDVDRIEIDWEGKARMIASAIVYFYWLEPLMDRREKRNLEMAQIISGLRAWDLQNASPQATMTWARREKRLRPVNLRIATMLACGVYDIEDLEAGIAMPFNEKLGAHADLVAALELIEWDRFRAKRPQYQPLREIIATTTPTTTAAKAA